MDLFRSSLPEVGEAEEVLWQMRGQYYEFEDLRRAIEQIKSKYPLEPPSENLEPIEDTPLFAGTESGGFSNQDVTFYNPTDQSVSFDPTEYFLKPTRRDVQRIGLFR